MIKFGFAHFLKANAGVRALVEDRVFPRRLDNQPALPALVINKISEVPETSHSGSSGLKETRLQVDVWGNSDEEMEQVKTAVIGAAHLYSGEMGESSVQTCFLEDDGDLFDEDAMNSADSRSNNFGGSLDFIITWT